MLNHLKELGCRSKFIQTISKLKHQIHNKSDSFSLSGATLRSFWVFTLYGKAIVSNIYLHAMHQMWFPFPKHHSEMDSMK